jgi:hypothetical protein
MISHADLRRWLLSATAVAMLFPLHARAQHGQDAGLIGTIRDRSGSILRGTTVTISSRQLIGGAETTATDAEGTYRFRFLPAGQYDIVADLAGFKTAKRVDIALVPGLTFTVDFLLDVADIEQTVVVRSAPPVVDVHASSSPVVIDRRLLENLPLSRDVTGWIGLAPGVVQNVAMGGAAFANPLSVDGANGTELIGGTPIVNPNLNWIDEVQVISAGADAQYGEYSSVLVNAITRSGSNHVSGLIDYWTTRPTWTGNNRGSLPPQFQDAFRPIEIISRWDSDYQLGGPVIKDRLWFFTGGESYRDANRPTSFNVQPTRADDPKYDAREHKFIAKLTSAISPAVRAEGFIDRATQDVTGANAGPLVAPEALAIANRAETMWSARLLWTLGSRAVVEVRSGGHDLSSASGPPADRRSGPPAHYDELTGVSSVNVNGIGDYQSRPITTGAYFTWFVPGRHRGSHEIRAGFEDEQAKLRLFTGLVGGRVFYDYGGQPSEVNLWDGATYRPSQSRRTVYIQDAWALSERLTVNAGIRAGFYHGSVPGYPDAFSAHSFSPRIGAAFDVTGDHRTVIRAHYGRYHDEIVAGFYDFLDPLSRTPDIFAAVVGPNQFVEEYRLSGTATASVDPSIKYPLLEEYLGGVERQLPWGISAKAQFISRDFKDAIGFIDPAKVWIPVQRVDPGPDGIRGTQDDGGLITVYFDQDPLKSAPVLTNPAAYRRYHAVQLIGSKRYSHDVEFLAAYTWSRTVGNYNNAAGANAAGNDLALAFSNPNLLINSDGRTPQDFTHDFKVIGTYRVPRWGGVNVSGIYKFQSGRPWARRAGFGQQTEVGFINVEPRGTREAAATNTLDLRVEKTWQLSQKFGRLGVFADAFNVWNQGVALRIINQSGPNLGMPQVWLDPRTVRAGARLIF